MAAYDTALDDLRRAVRERVQLDHLIAETAGGEFTGPPRDRRTRCPLHGGDNKTSLSVNVDGGTWYCHSCGAGGDAFSWLQKAEGMTFRQAAEELAHRAGVDWPPEPERKAGSSPWGIEDYAAHVLLPIAWLRDEAGLVPWERKWQNGIAIPYLDGKGNLLRYRPRLNGTDRRWAMLDEWRCGECGHVQSGGGSCDECGGDTERQPDDPGGEGVYPYGLDRLALDHGDGPLLIVEGESDAQVAHFCELRALGAPGQTIFRAEWALRLPEGTEEVFVLRERDGTLPEAVRDAVAEAEVPVMVREFELPTDDLLDLWRSVGASKPKLREAVEAALETATTVEPPPDANRYFGGKTGTTFIPLRLARELAEARTYTVGYDPERGGGRLMEYSEGWWRPAVGIDLLAHRRLGERVRDHQVREVEHVLRREVPWVPWGDWNPRRDLINCADGMLDPTTGELFDHDPNFLSLFRVPLRWRPDATSELLDRFLADVLPDEETIELILMIVGYLLTTEIRAQKYFVLEGPAGTGKTTLFEATVGLLGERNWALLTLQDLADNRFAPARLENRQLGCFDDLDAAPLESASMVRALTGGFATLPVERKGVDSYEAPLYARLLFTTNEMPPGPDKTSAWYDRLILVPVLRRFRGTDREDKHLGEKLAAREVREALFARAVEALRSLIVDHHWTFPLPAHVQERLARYRARNDTVGAFLDAECVRDPGAQVPRSRWYEAYEQWCRRVGEAELSREAVYKTLAHDHGVGQQMSGGQRYLRGVGLAYRGDGPPPQEC